MTIIDELNDHLRYLEERCRLIPILEQRLEDAQRATREARRQLAVAEAQRQRPTRDDTDTDLAVIRHLANGAPVTQVGVLVGLTVNGVKSRIQRLYKRYGVNSHVRLVVSALRQGDLDVADVIGEWEGDKPTAQQQRVLQATADYGSNAAAGAALGITGNTVAVHLHKTSYQAGTGLKVQMVARAFKAGFVE